MGCSNSIPVSQNVMNEIKEVSREDNKDTNKKYLDKDKLISRKKTTSKDDKHEKDDQVSMWG